MDVRKEMTMEKKAVLGLPQINYDKGRIMIIVKYLNINVSCGVRDRIKE
jgi:hypothetical protein